MARISAVAAEIMSFFMKYLRSAGIPPLLQSCENRRDAEKFRDVYPMLRRTYGEARESRIRKMNDFTIRRARRGDERIVLTLLRDLADYEKLLDGFHIDESVISRDYFGETPLLNCDLAFEGKEPVGLATWYWTYHSFA